MKLKVMSCLLLMSLSAPLIAGEKEAYTKEVKPVVSCEQKREQYKEHAGEMTREERRELRKEMRQQVREKSCTQVKESKQKEHSKDMNADTQFYGGVLQGGLVRHYSETVEQFEKEDTIIIRKTMEWEVPKH